MNSFKKKPDNLTFLFAILSFIYLVWATSPTITPFYYWYFVPYPKLEDAIIYTGMLSVEGYHTCDRKGFCTAQKYFVTDSSGKHEIYYGVLGARQTRWEYPNENKAIGTFWFQPEYGVIQEIYKLNITDPRFKNPKTDTEFSFIGYERIKIKYEKGLDCSRWLWRAVPFFISLFGLCFVIREFVVSRRNR
jgi:hypothetical protein